LPSQPAEPAAVERTPVALVPPTKPVERPKIKILATGRAPLAEQSLPDGGLITALVSSSLGRAGQGDAKPAEIDVQWAKSAQAPIQSLLNDRSIDISLPWEKADCERPNDLVQTSAVLCDNAVYSDPILQVVIGLFTLSDSAFKFDTDESIFGKTICVPQDRDVTALNENGRNWLSEKRVTALRQPALVDCISAVQKGEAEAFIANDLEARYTIGKLGLGSLFKMAERPLGMRGVHAIVSKEHPQASELIDAVNRGLRQLKQGDVYATILRQHLMRLWDARARTP
jgi:polar amino acid transport system substrate-binding protein